MHDAFSKKILNYNTLHTNNESGTATVGGTFFFLHGELYTELGALCTVTSKVLYLLVMY